MMTATNADRLGMPFEKHSRSMRDHCANMSSHYVSRYFPHYNLTI